MAQDLPLVCHSVSSHSLPPCVVFHDSPASDASTDGLPIILYDKRRTKNIQEDGIDGKKHRRRRAHTIPARTELTTPPHSGIPPCLVLAGANAYYLWNEHWEHWAHMPPLEERVEYPFQNIRTRNFPWGDGDKVCSTTHSLASLNQVS